MTATKILQPACLILFAAAFLLVPNAAALAQTYGLDKGHTDIRFQWNHAGVSDQSGRFNDFDGELVLDAGDVSKSSLSVTIKTDSLSTGVDGLDKHLKSADFFETAKYPEATFKSTSVVQTAKGAARVTGDMTIHGVTKPVTFDVHLVHIGDHPLGKFIDHYKGQWLGMKAKTVILRSDFGVGMFAPLTSDRIAITVNTELKAK